MPHLPQGQVICPEMLPASAKDAVLYDASRVRVYLLTQLTVQVTVAAVPRSRW